MSTPIHARFASKADFLAKSKAYWNPGKTQFWQDAGIDLVIDRREGYFLYDLSGHRLIDMHLNGGTYNLGHRHPELVQALKDGLDHFDMGNHHFPALCRTALAEELHKVEPALAAIHDLRLRRRRGDRHRAEVRPPRRRQAQDRLDHQGLSRPYRACRLHRRSALLRAVPGRPPGRVHPGPVQRPGGHGVSAQGRDVAAVIMETIPATYGFPMPADGYLPAVKALCERYGAFYIADEVQTGLMRTGQMWAITGYGVTPDILVTAKGISGGLYTLGCVLVSEETGAWLHQDGFGHISTGGGAELGCLVALKVLEICQRPEVRANVHAQTALWAEHLRAIQALHPDFFTGIRQNGVVMGLEFDHPEGAKHVMRALYRNGVWAIFSTLDPRVLQWKPGLLLTPELCLDVLERLERSIGQARTARGRRMSWKTAHRSFYYQHAPEPADLVLPPAADSTPGHRRPEHLPAASRTTRTSAPAGRRSTPGCRAPSSPTSATCSPASAPPASSACSPASPA